MSAENLPYEETWFKNKIDLDRLHAVIDGHLVGQRGAGQTFATMMQLVGEAYLGDPKNWYLYVGEGDRYYIVNDVMRSFYNILIGEGFDCRFDRAKGQVFVRNTEQMFTFSNMHKNLPYQYKGCRFAGIFADLLPHTIANFQRELEELQLTCTRY